MWTGAFIGLASIPSSAPTTVGPSDDGSGDSAEEPIALPVNPDVIWGGGARRERRGDCSADTGESWYEYFWRPYGATSFPLGAEACLVGGPLVPGTPPGYYPPGYSHPPYDAGHLIGKQLGGSGKEPGSLFSRRTTPNRGRMQLFESDIREKVEAGETIYYVVALGYSGGGAVPSNVSLMYGGSRGSSGFLNLGNVC